MMKRLAVAVMAVGSLALTSQAFAATTDDGTFTASTTTTASISVSCDENLSFGTLAVEAINPEATVTVAASAGAPATSSDTAAVFVAAAGGPAMCTVTNETGSNATASLAAPTGTFTAPTLAGVSLKMGTDVLSADLTLSKTDNITNEALYIGGTVTIPTSFAAHGVYTETVTLTITD